MIKAEYLRFLKKLKESEVPENVCKIANIVSSNIDTIIPLSTSQGKRIKKIVELAQTNWKSIPSNISITEDELPSSTDQFKLLQNLSVGPFRGFITKEDFDLSSNLVLIYGPNGDGKSSFSEALEYCLLGHVAEAESKRFRNQNEYLKNAHVNKFENPTLIGTNNEGHEIEITSNETLYRFCFIEKNRIDNFSRIAAQAPAVQTELISSLFGLDSFFNFVHNFTEVMDERYIDLKGIKQIELNKKRQDLSGYQQQLKTILPDEYKKIKEDENKLANEYRENCLYFQMLIEIDGDDENTGKITDLEEKLQKPIGTKSGQTLSHLHELQNYINSNIKDLSTKQKELNNSSQQLSFKQLYEAVIKIQDNSSDSCPACQTPLSQVKVNPFEYADSELEKLKHLGTLQETIKELNDNINISFNSLSEIIDACVNHLAEKNPIKDCLSTISKNLTVESYNSLHHKSKDKITLWEEIETHIKQLEDLDNEIDKAVSKREEYQTELTRLRNFKENIVKLQTRKETANNSTSSANEAISDFDKKNDQLIKDAESEKEVVSQNRSISEAYNLFVDELNLYKNGLPALLVEDLGEQIVILYNAFNRQDSDHEKIAKINLPLQQNQKIEISYHKDPNLFYDALHILSEGHIRCIGLSILPVKNIIENSPYLIFDDPVNAIDDDHRESIRRTLFEDTFFDNKQIILTCHGEEFLKDIHNLLSVDKSKNTKTISFLPKIKDYHISVDRNCSPRNYIIAARTHYNKSEIRDALDKCRKALESLTKDKIWKYVSKYGDGNLSIKMRSANASIELRNLTEQLKCKINKSNFSDSNKDSILSPLQTLLGISGDSREWRYLNKGTHEEADRAEFDRNTVDVIIFELEKVDSALASP